MGSNTSALTARPWLTRRTASLFLAGTLLISGSATLSGCYGTFPLTSAVYKFNGRLPGGGIVRSLVMILFVIIPVYGIAMFVDAIVFNLIEFWSGTRISSASTFDQPDGTVIVLGPGGADNEALLRHLRGDEVLIERLMVRGDDGTTLIYDEAGEIVGRVTPRAEGGFTLASADGVRQAEITPELIASLSQ